MTISVPTSLELVNTNVVESEYVNYADIIDNVFSISAGSSHTMYVKTDGTLWATGDNTFGQLGFNTFNSLDEFTYTGIDNVRSVHCFNQSSLIIKNDGSVWAAGSSYNGQLGLGNTEDVPNFTYVGIDNAKSIAIGAYHSMIITSDGSLYSSGFNLYGQLGLADNDDRVFFTKVPVTNVDAVSCGGYFTAIVKSDSTLWTTGANNYGQLGLGNNTDVNIFTSTGVTAVSKVSCGASHMGIIKKVPSLMTTGYNFSGQLGLGDNTNRNVLTLTSILDASAISCGQYHTCIIRSGVLWGTGANGDGQLGLNTLTNVNVFTSTSLSNTKRVSCGYSHTIILKGTISKVDEKVWVTGLNNSGQLGLNNFTSTKVFTDTLNYAAQLGQGIYYAARTGDILIKGNSRYSVTPVPTSPSIFFNMSYIGANLPTMPFDGKNYTYATSTTTMTYTVKGTQKFDTIALGRCKADSVTIVFKNSLGVTVNTVTKTIDSSRDTSGNLEKWHTTVIYYATSTVEANGTVEVTLTGANIELGTLMLGMSVSAGFTKLELQNSFIDYSVYQEDEWGNIDYVSRAKIAVYKGSCDILITNYDMTDRLLTSIGGNLIILNGSDSKNTTPDSQSVFASTQKIGRLFDLSQQTKVKDNGMDNRATYSFTLKETV